TDPSPEAKLLRAIFGDKAGDVKDASLKASPSVRGVVIDTKLFSRAKKTNKAEEKGQLDKLEEEHQSNLEALKNVLVDQPFQLVDGETSQGGVNRHRKLLIPNGAKITQNMLHGLIYDSINPLKWDTDEEKNELIKQLLHS